MASRGATAPGRFALSFRLWDPRAAAWLLPAAGLDGPVARRCERRKPCTPGEHQNRWYMGVPPQNGIGIAYPWPNPASPPKPGERAAAPPSLWLPWPQRLRWHQNPQHRPPRAVSRHGLRCSVCCATALPTEASSTPPGCRSSCGRSRKGSGSFAAYVSYPVSFGKLHSTLSRSSAHAPLNCPKHEAQTN